MPSRKDNEREIESSVVMIGENNKEDHQLSTLQDSQNGKRKEYIMNRLSR